MTHDLQIVKALLTPIREAIERTHGLYGTRKTTGTGITHSRVSNIDQTIGYTGYHLIVYVKPGYESIKNLIPTSYNGIPIITETLYIDVIRPALSTFSDTDHVSPIQSTSQAAKRLSAKESFDQLNKQFSAKADHMQPTTKADHQAKVAAIQPSTPVFPGKYRPLQGGSSFGTILSDPDLPSGQLWEFIGTIAAFVKDSNGNTVILTNNHVIAFDIPSKNLFNTSNITYQPGPGEVGSNHATDGVGNPVDRIPIQNQNNTVDCAISSIISGITLDPNYLCNYQISDQTIEADIGMPLTKTGRTTGCTDAFVETIDVNNVPVTYSLTYPNGNKFSVTVYFDNQIIISPNSTNPISISGDSGSLWVTKTGNNPVALNFAGGVDSIGNEIAIANRIQPVLSTMNLTLIAIIPILTSITLSPSNPTISVGQTIQLTITCKNQNYNIMGCPVLTITNSNPSVATFDPSLGLITGISVGTATITATYGSNSSSISSNATINVIAICPSNLVCGSVVKIIPKTTPPPPAPNPDIETIDLAPVNPSISVNNFVQMTPTCKNSSGNIIRCGYLLWTIENTKVASIDSNGKITGKSAGTTTIRATALSNLPKIGSTTLIVV